MTLIRRSDADRDDHILVNLDHIVQVTAIKRARGQAEHALVLRLALSDGRSLDCFPVDANGGFDSASNDESQALWSFQQAAARVRHRPDLSQGVVDPDAGAHR